MLVNVASHVSEYRKGSIIIGIRIPNQKIRTSHSHYRNVCCNCVAGVLLDEIGWWIERFDRYLHLHGAGLESHTTVVEGIEILVIS